MNASSKVRGQADGFDLNVLPQLMDIKSTQSPPTSSLMATPTSISLLQFIVSYFVKYKVSTKPQYCVHGLTRLTGSD